MCDSKKRNNASTEKINLEGIVIIVGNYGSGKSEISINLAIYMKKIGMEVIITDLDLINMYFRIREAKDLLNKHSIKVIIPQKKYLYADLPICTPEISGMLKNPKQLSIIDCGGDEAGVTVLGTFSDSLNKVSKQVLQVINPFRPD